MTSPTAGVRAGPAGSDSGEGEPATYVVLDVATTRYGVDVNRALGVVDAGSPTRVPGAPPAILGVMNVKGRVLPVADLGMALEAAGGDGAPAGGRPSTALLLGPSGADVADLALLGEVLDVVEIPGHLVEPPPAFGLGAGAPLIHAVARHEGEVVLLLDPERLLASLGAGGVREGSP